MSKTTKQKQPAPVRVRPVVRPTGVKTHHFVLGVKTHGTRKDAELAVFASFAKRQPDGCEFYLRALRKEEWMQGAKAGMQTAFELMRKQIENLQKHTGAIVRNGRTNGGANPTGGVE